MSESQESVTPPSEEVVQEQVNKESSPEVSNNETEQAEELQSKKDSGEKLSKKEEKQLKEYKLKVNGRDKVVKFDPTNDEEVLKYLQKAEASDSKFKEASEIRNAAVSFLEELRKNPKKVLSDPNIGVDLKKFAEEIMNDALQDMEKTPEQRALEKAQKELEELKKQREEEKKYAEQQEFQRLQMEHERQLETDISAALDVGGLPKTARTVKAMAEMMMIALQNNIDLSAQEILPIVKNNTVSEFKEIVNSFSDDQLEDFLGKEIISRLRKKNVAKAKAIETANSIKSIGSEAKKQEVAQSAKKQTIRDFLKI